MYLQRGKEKLFIFYILSFSGGCYPPGAAFANTSMVEKLNMHEVKFEMDPKILL